eukprot:352854-Chlamydomonas_euryale.AAC.6
MLGGVPPEGAAVQGGRCCVADSDACRLLVHHGAAFCIQPLSCLSTLMHSAARCTIQRLHTIMLCSIQSLGRACGLCCLPVRCIAWLHPAGPASI